MSQHLVNDPDSQDNAYRRDLEKMRVRSAERYDSVLLTLSGGALAASLSIVPNFVEYEAVWRYTLVWAWGTLTLTILCVGFSFFAAEKAARKAIDDLDSSNHWVQPDNCWNATIPWLNAVGGLSFVAGLILMITFAAANFL